MSLIEAKSRYGLIQVSTVSKSVDDKIVDSFDTVLVYHDGKEHLRGKEDPAGVYSPIFSMSELELFIFKMNALFPCGWSMDTVARKLATAEFDRGNQGAALINRAEDPVMGSWQEEFRGHEASNSDQKYDLASVLPKQRAAELRDLKETHKDRLHKDAPENQKKDGQTRGPAHPRKSAEVLYEEAVARQAEARAAELASKLASQAAPTKTEGPSKEESFTSKVVRGPWNSAS